MTYQETLTQLQDTTARAVLSLHAQLEAGTLTGAEFMDLAALVLETARRQGLSLGALSIRAYLEQVTGEPQPAPVPTPPPETPDRQRIRAGLDTVLAGPHEQIATRLERIALNEPIEAATSGAEQAIRADSRVKGWTRGLEADACEMCVWWWRQGRVWQSDHPMPRHTGCVCNPVPAIAVATDNAQTTKQAWTAARAAGRAPKETATA